MPYKDRETRLAYARAHRKTYRHPDPAAQRLAKRDWQRAYRLAHPEKHRALIRAYRLAHPEWFLDYQRDYRLTHKEEARAYKANPLIKERNRIQRKARYHANPAIDITANRRRRAQKRGAPLNDLTHAQWLEIQSAQKYRCYYCGKRCKGRLTQDHIIPLSKGGSHTLHNVIGACNSCNASKKAGPPPVPVQPLLLTIAPARKKRSS